MSSSLENSNSHIPKSYSLFLGMSSFLLALQIGRLLSFFFWGDAEYNHKTVLFFLGSKNGDQLPAYLYYCLVIPSIAWLWLSFSTKALRFLNTKEFPFSLPKAIFFAVQIMICYPFFTFLIEAARWTAPCLIAAFVIVAMLDRFGDVNSKLNSAINILQAKWTFLLALLFLWYWIFPGWGPPFRVDLYHEGAQLGPASDFLLGKVPFREIFIDQGLFHNVLKPAAAFLIFGESVASKKLLFSLTHPLGYIALAIVGRIFIKNVLTWMLTFLLLSLAFIYFPDRHFFSLIATACFAKHILTIRDSTTHISRHKISKRIWIILAGFSSGLQVWNSVEIGVFVLSVSAALFLFDVSQRGKNRLISNNDWFAYLLGLVIGTGPVILYLIYNKALEDFLWVTGLRLFLHTQAEGIPYIIMKISPLIARGQPSFPGLFNDRHFLWYLPLVIHLSAISYFLCRWKVLSPLKRYMGILLIATSTSHFYPALIHRDFEHLSFSSPITFVLGIWVMQEFWTIISLMRFKSRPLFFMRVFYVAGSLTFLWYFVSVFSLGTRFMNRIEDFHKKVDFSSKIDCRKRLSGVKISQETAELTKKIQEFSSPNDPMVNLTTEGGLLFMANRKSLTRYYNIDVIYTLAMEKEVIGQIDRAHNSVILSSVRLLLENRMGRRLRALENYIEQNFQEVWQDRERALWRWKTPVPAF